MTLEETLEVLEMFLHKQCDLERTKRYYDANTVQRSVNMAYYALRDKKNMENEKLDIEYMFEGL